MGDYWLITDCWCNNFYMFGEGIPLERKFDYFGFRMNVAQFKNVMNSKFKHVSIYFDKLMFSIDEWMRLSF